MYSEYILFVLMRAFAAKVNHLPVAGNAAKFCPSPGAVVRNEERNNETELTSTLCTIPTHEY